jgi:hypothetical protein
MHKRTIALAAAALLFNGAAIAQATQKQEPRPHRSANNGRAEDAKPEGVKQA